MLDFTLFVLTMCCIFGAVAIEIFEKALERQPSPIEGTIGREAIHQSDLVRYIGERFVYFERVGIIDSFYKAGPTTMVRVKLDGASSNAEIVSFPERDLEVA